MSYEPNNTSEDIGASAQEASKRAKQEVKNVARRATSGVSNKAKQMVTRKGMAMAGKAVKLTAKAMMALGKALVAVIGKIIVAIGAALGPIGLAALAVGLILTVVLSVFNFRGIFELFSVSRYLPMNVTAQMTEARKEAIAYSEPQALIEAYYSYMSCNSITKYFKSEEFNFNGDEKEVEDFAGLTDYYKRENYFYLSSEFLRLADEMFHKREFYYPEQLIKPVYHTSTGSVATIPLIDRGRSGISEATGSNVDLSTLSEEEIILSQALFGEAAGLGATERAAVIWCILNRVDTGTYGDLATVVTKKTQFKGWLPWQPVLDTHLAVVIDVLERWEREKSGETDVGRVLPSGYHDFRGSGGHNHFKKSWYDEEEPYWDWSLPSPYEGDASPPLPDRVTVLPDDEVEPLDKRHLEDGWDYDIWADEYHANGGYGSSGDNETDPDAEHTIKVESLAYELGEDNRIIEDDDLEETVNTVWDWGLGSVLQYDFYKKNKYLSYTYSSISAHVHIREKLDPTENLDDYLTGNMNEHCIGDINIILAEGDSYDFVISEAKAIAEEKIDKAYNKSIAEGGIDETYNWKNDWNVKIYGLGTGTLGGEYTGEDSANKFNKLKDILEHNALMVEDPEKAQINMPIQAEDYAIAERVFNHNVFDDYDNTSKYPLNIPMISRAATMSGNIVYSYSYETTKEELTVGIGDEHAPVTDQLIASSGAGAICSNCSGYTSVATRAGGIYTEMPFPSEKVYPWGLEYLRDYATLYQAIVPEDVILGNSFQERISNSLSSKWFHDGGEFSNSYHAMIALGILSEEVTYGSTNIYGQTGIEEVRIYGVQDFNMVNAMTLLQANTVTTNPYIQGAINALNNSFAADVLSFIDQILTSTKDMVVTFGRETLGFESAKKTIFTGQVNADDMYSLVMSSLSFSQGVTYNDADIQTPSDLEDYFIFVGMRGAIVTGTSPFEYFVPAGISTSSTDSVSPTKGFYQLVAPWDGGSVVLRAPSGTGVFAVANGTVTASLNGRVTIQHTIDGETYSVTYSNLEKQSKGGIGVSEGQTVTMGEQIGIVAADTWLSMGFSEKNFTLTVKNSAGTIIDPMSLFYLSSEEGVPIYSQAVKVDKASETEAELSESLNKSNNYTSNNRDRWHTPQGLNRLSEWSTSWWAWGRGAQLLESFGYPVATTLPSYGDPSKILEATESVFMRGMTPRANSWVVFTPKEGSSDKPLLGYVEALIYGESAVTGFIVSYTDSTDKTIQVKTVPVNHEGLSYFSSAYETSRFIYLDRYIGGMEGSATLGGGVGGMMGGGFGGVGGASSGIDINADGMHPPIDPNLSTISSRFGLRSLGYHYGLDLAAPEGTPIYAVADGTVIRVTKNVTGFVSGSFGNYVFIKHDDGTITRYAHMVYGGVFVNVNDRVVAGQHIGAVGNTGHSYGNHLHWEWLPPGQGQIDPFPMWVALTPGSSNR